MVTTTERMPPQAWAARASKRLLVHGQRLAAVTTQGGAAGGSAASVVTPEPPRSLPGGAQNGTLGAGYRAGGAPPTVGTPVSTSVPRELIGTATRGHNMVPYPQSQAGWLQHLQTPQCAHAPSPPQHSGDLPRPPSLSEDQRHLGRHLVTRETRKCWTAGLSTIARAAPAQARHCSCACSQAAFSTTRR